MSFLNDIKVSFRTSSIAEKFIYTFVGIFIIGLILPIIYNFFSLPSGVNNFVVKPWTILSYGFLHGNFFHLLFNAIFMFYFGNLFLNFFSSKQFVNYFILGTLAGGICFLLLGFGNSLVGASAGLMAILVGLATKIPTYEVRFNLIGGVKLWIIALVYILVSLSGLDGKNAGGNVAHLGGALIGFLYTKQLESGNDIGKWIENILNFFTNLLKPTQKKSPLKTVYKNSHINRKPTHKESKAKQQKIDEILDKISKSGYESLNADEREFLFKSGNK